jgi:hypothetical protein
MRIPLRKLIRYTKLAVGFVAIYQYYNLVMMSYHDIEDLRNDGIDAHEGKRWKPLSVGGKGRYRGS